MLGFLELYEQIKKNLEYWSRNIMINTNYGIDMDDAFQELLITVFNVWSKKSQVTKYYIQKRLYLANLRILRNYYSQNEAQLNPIHIEDLKIKINEEDYDYQIVVSDEVDRLINRIELNDMIDELKYRLDKEGKEGSPVKAILEMLIVGMSLKEIADELNMKKSNVHRIKEHKIKKILKSLMKK